MRELTENIFKEINRILSLMDEFHDKELILHDCVADRVSCVDGILRFHFPEGFWITPNHKESHCDKVVRTNASAVDFSVKNIDDAYVRVFTQNIFKKTYTDICSIRTNFPRRSAFL